MIKPLIGERLEHETKRAIQACNDYLRMGPGRSLVKLHQFYVETTVEKPPTKTLRTLASWSSAFGWVARAEAYDTEAERIKDELLEERRLAALHTGLALDYERIIKLKHLADTLGAEIWQQDGEFVKDAIWLPDVKQIGSGDYAERVDIVRFNQAILSEFRSILDDLAKETGGRKQRLEHTGSEGGPIKFTQIEVQLNRESVES